MTVEIKLNNTTYELPSHIVVLPEANEEHYTKLDLSRFGDHEGIWMVIHEKDIQDYKDDVVDENYTRVGVLMNQSLCGIPWGAYVPYKLQGQSRPVAVFEDIINPETDDVHFPPEVLKAYQEAVAEHETSEENENDTTTE